jgi:hypothetical protein
MRYSMGVLSRLAPGMASSLASHLFVTPRRFRRPAWEEPIFRTADRSFLRLGTQAVATYSWGDESHPYVALMHGWEGRATQLGAFVEPLLAQGLRVIGVDAPGHGASAGRKSSMPDFIDACFAVRRAHGQPHGVIAHSLGAAATALAMQQGLDAKRLVFIAPPSHLDSIPDEFGRIVGVSPEVCLRLKANFEQKFAIRWKDLDIAKVGTSCDSPLLVVHDRDDGDVAYAQGVRVATTWRTGTLHTTSGLGHRRILRDTETVATVAAFVGAGR